MFQSSASDVYGISDVFQGLHNDFDVDLEAGNADLDHEITNAAAVNVSAMLHARAALAAGNTYVAAAVKAAAAISATETPSAGLTAISTRVTATCAAEKNALA